MNKPTQIGLPERAAAMRGFDRAGATFDNADVVHSEARRRLLERLQLVRLEPACIVDLGSATGKGAAELAAAFPEARIVAGPPCSLKYAAFIDFHPAKSNSNFTNRILSKYVDDT